MTIGALVAYQIGHSQGDAVTGATMLLTALSLFHVAGALLCRDQLNTIFDRDAIPGRMQLRRYGLSLVAILAATGLGFLNRILDTTTLTLNQWFICAGLAVSIVVVEELIKLVIRRRGASRSDTAPSPLVPALTASA
jgi:Ca2+-transporting ATPase